MNKNIYNLYFAITLIMLLLSFSSCNKTKSCPDGNLCVEGNIYEYQLRTTSSKLIIEVPEGAVYGNASVTITDLIPAYPANSNFSEYDRHFAGGYFNVEPHDLPLKQLIKISIEYPGTGIMDDAGNNFENDLRLWFIDDDENWSIFPSSLVDTENNRVYAWVGKLGRFAVAAEKECIISEWRQGDSLAVYPYHQRVVFNLDMTGRREFIIECGTDDWQESGENFKWFLTSGQLRMYNFTTRSVCDTTTKSIDKTIDFDCTGPTLFLGDLPAVTYERY